ncbi:uncharacterized protein PG998_002650 [Apiospora kogelbergensis]|uniref:uncharacterized protein n=1 Tax=Apiospora kogelbergensis TaxID=1337665 RepID=UPI00312D8A13
MADPLSIASGVAGLVSLTVQATQLTCKYVAEVSHAGEVVLQCLRSLSLLRDVLARIEESSADGELASILMRKSRWVPIPYEDVKRCEQSIEKVRGRLAALFHEDGKIKKRHALTWPFKNTESTDLIKQLQEFRDMFAAVAVADSLDVSVKSHQVAVDTRSAVRDIKDDMISGKRDLATRALIDWIFPDNMETWRLGGDKEPHQGTGSWFFDSTEHLDWIESGGTKRGVLWCKGAPGSGKSVLMSQAISHIQNQLPQTSGSPAAIVLSHFCDHRDSRTQSPDVIIRHLMRQAALQSDAVLDNLQTCAEYQDAKRSGRSLRLAELSRIFVDNCLSADPRFLIVLDGLDECAEDLDGLEARHEVLQLITKAASLGIRVLTASRDIADIRAELSDCCSELKVRAPDADLRAYVTSRLYGIEKRVPQAKRFKDAIVDKVIRDADGIFLLARLMMDILAPSSINNVRQIKKFLGEGSCDLNKMYRETLDRIMSNNAISAELAQKALLWLCYAQRPLREAEIQHALATEMGDEDFDPDGITPGELLQASCMGIVICDAEGIYSLFHQTAYDFFRSSPELGPAAAHLLISQTCLCYLSFATMREQGPCQDLKALEERRERLSLLDYAAKHWSDHARQVEGDVVDSVVAFITDNVLRECLGQAFYHRKRDDWELKQMMFDSLPTGSTALQTACGRGLPITAKRLLTEDQNAQSVAQADNQGWTPLISASSYGHGKIVDLLLAHTAAVGISGEDTAQAREEGGMKSPDVVGLDKADNAGWTPLFWAIVKGHEHVAEQLLAAGACASLKDKSNWTPIDWASFRADRSLVTLLLQYTSLPREKTPRSFYSRSGVYRPREFSPIFLAAAAGDDQTVETLLQHGNSAQEGSGEAARSMYNVISKAERFYKHCDVYTYVSMPSVLLTKKFAIRLFESAIRSDQPAIVKMLVELGSTLGAVEGEQKNRSALHIAACCGKTRICEYLLSKGADASLQDKDGNTPLDLAISVAAIPCIKLFLECLDSGSKEISRLIEMGSAPAVFAFGWYSKIKRRSYRRRNSDATVRDQLNPHVRPDSQYMLEASRTLIQNTLADNPQTNDCDSECEQEGAIIEVLQALLDHGCDVNCVEQDKKQTALHYACMLSKPKVVSFLLENGADVGITGEYGGSCLYLACDTGTVSLEVVRTLVQSGVDVNACNRWHRSPLLEACKNASAEIVRFLTASGAHVNTYDNLERHPLHMACSRSPTDPETRDDTLELIEHILELSGPEILSRSCESYNFEGVSNAKPTVLNYAIQAENWAVVDFLRARGATALDTSLVSAGLLGCVADARGATFRRLVDDFGADAADADRRKPLVAHCVRAYHRERRAASDGFADNVAALLEAGADINAGGSSNENSVERGAIRRCARPAKTAWTSSLCGSCWRTARTRPGRRAGGVVPRRCLRRL